LHSDDVVRRRSYCVTKRTYIFQVIGSCCFLPEGMLVNGKILSVG